MKTLIAAVAFATVFVAPAFAQCMTWAQWGCKSALAAPASANPAFAQCMTWAQWGCKSALAAPASAKSTYAASFNDRRSALSDRRSERSGRRAPVRHWAQW